MKNITFPTSGGTTKTTSSGSRLEYGLRIDLNVISMKHAKRHFEVNFNLLIVRYEKYAYRVTNMQRIEKRSTEAHGSKKYSMIEKEQWVRK